MILCFQIFTSSLFVYLEMWMIKTMYKQIAKLFDQINAFKVIKEFHGELKISLILLVSRPEGAIGATYCPRLLLLVSNTRGDG